MVMFTVVQDSVQSISFCQEDRTVNITNQPAKALAMGKTYFRDYCRTNN